MGRALQTPTPTIKGITTVVPSSKGGTGVSSINAIPQALGVVSELSMGLPSGVAKVGTDGFVRNSQLPLSAVSDVTIDGPDDIYQGQAVAFTITNYDINTPYVISVSAGSVSRVGATINYTAPATGQSVVMTVNTRDCAFQVKTSVPIKPSITVPAYGTKISGTSTTLTSSLYSGTVSAHFSSDWQIASDIDFAVMKFQTVNDTTSMTSWAVTGLVAATNYVARVRHKATDGTYSEWSEPVRFSTL